MTDQKDQYINTLLQINFALVTGMESAITFIENIDKVGQEQRDTLIGQMKGLVEASRNAFRERQEH